MKAFKLLDNNGTILYTKNYEDKEFSFMIFIEDFFNSTGLELEDVDIQKSINTINKENGLNIKSILCIEDDEILRQVAERYGVINGHFVLSVETAEEAEVLFKRYPELFSIVFIDKALPGLDGDTFSKKLKSFNKNIKAYIVTGDPSSVDESVRDCGVEEIIEKPFTYEIFSNTTGKAS